jgi:hypothetical protein
MEEKLSQTAKIAGQIENPGRAHWHISWSVRIPVQGQDHRLLKRRAGWWNQVGMGNGDGSWWITVHVFFWRSTTSSLFVNMAVVHLRMSKAKWNPPSICRIYRLPLSIFHDAQTPGLDTYRHIPSPMDPLGKEPSRDDKVRSCFCRNSCDIHVIIGKSHGIMDNHNR